MPEYSIGPGGMFEAAVLFPSYARTRTCTRTGQVGGWLTGSDTIHGEPQGARHGRLHSVQALGGAVDGHAAALIWLCHSRMRLHVEVLL